VRSANKVSFVDAVHGADLDARAAAGAERVVDGREIVDNGYCSVRTGLLTLHAADTAVCAIFSYRRALIVVRALDHDALGVVDKVDDTVGALSHTDAAADTLSRVNVGDAVLN